MPLARWMQQHDDSECDDQRAAGGDDQLRGEPLLRGGDGQRDADRDGRRDLQQRRGLSINGGTGAIDLVASTPGTYTVTYAFSSGGCNNTTTASVTINALPVATIALRREPLLRGGDSERDADRDGRRDLQHGGRAEHQRGHSGQIDLVASTPGTYTVTYAFSSGGCNNTSDSECDDQRAACGDDHLRREPLLRGGDSECGADRDGRRDLQQQAQG